MDLAENKPETLTTAPETDLDVNEISSLLYHDIFDYPLSLGELIKWRAGKKLAIKRKPLVVNKNRFYFIEGREGLILKRLLKERISARKLEIARKAGKILGLIPTVKMVAVTGALAMSNASEEDDIDLMVVSQKGTLWTTRLLALLFLDIIGFPRRKYGDRKQKDKLCLNIWLDETSLTWPARDRNLYTAHEIAQVKPILNRDKTYEKFLAKNEWLKAYWPNAVRIKNLKYFVGFASKIKNSRAQPSILEKIAYRLQYAYMRKKITRETITPHKAIFHPNDWGKIVLKKFYM